MIPGSYANGFAPRDESPLYPQLWRGCVGAWCPSLGPTGATLREWSGRNNHATVTNLDLHTGWAINAGKFALNLDGDAYADTNNGSAFDFGTGNMSASVWFSTGTGNRRAFGTFGGNGRGYGLFLDNTGPDWFFIGASGSNDLTATGTIIDSRWHNTTATLTGSGALTIFLDGKQIGTQTATVGDMSSTGNLLLGTYLNSTNAMIGYLGECRVYDRILSASEIRLLAFQQGIAYVMRDLSTTVRNYAGEPPDTTGVEFSVSRSALDFRVPEAELEFAASNTYLDFATTED